MSLIAAAYQFLDVIIVKFGWFLTFTKTTPLNCSVITGQNCCVFPLFLSQAGLKHWGREVQFK